MGPPAWYRPIQIDMNADDSELRCLARPAIPHWSRRFGTIRIYLGSWHGRLIIRRSWFDPHPPHKFPQVRNSV